MAARWRIALLLCCLGGGTTAASVQPVAIELLEKAAQRAGAPTLGDVAKITGSDAQLRNMQLPVRGKVGDTVVYTRAELGELVATMRGNRGGEVRWSGAERVLVERRGVAVPAAEYIAWAEALLREHWAARGGKLELKAVNEYRPLTLPEGGRSIAARFAGDDVRRTARVWLDIAVDGHYYTTATVTFDVGWWKPALVLKQRGEALQRLRPDMVDTADADISLTNGAVVQDSQSLHGKRLKRETAAGVALAESDIEDIPAVEAGATIKVFTTVGRIAVQTLAVALRDGAVGQHIAVKKPRSNEQLMVEVTGENRAVVSERQIR